MDSAASGNYVNNKTMVCNKKMIQPGTGIEVECADKGIMHQVGEGKLLFNNVLEGTNGSTSSMTCIHHYLVAENLSEKENVH